MRGDRVAPDKPIAPLASPRSWCARECKAVTDKITPWLTLQPIFFRRSPLGSAISLRGSTIICGLKAIPLGHATDVIPAGAPARVRCRSDSAVEALLLTCPAAVNPSPTQATALRLSKSGRH
jgi:hypothetical protein